MLNRSQVLSRPGWNPTILRDLLGEPDQREPRQGPCPGSSLYNLSRVLDVEGSQQFRDAVAGAMHRARATKKSAVSKRKQLLGASATWPITVALIPIDELYRRVLQGDDPSVIETVLVDDDDPMTTDFVFQRMTTAATRKKKITRVVEYGPYLPTLARLLEEGYFE